MALIPCPHCGKEISSYAKRCPGCGKDLTQTCEKVNKGNVGSASTPEIRDTKLDYNKIFHITEDEFKGEKTVGMRFGLEGNPEMDSQSERLHAKKPSIAILYTSSAYGNYFTFAYYETDLVNKIKELNATDYDSRIGAPSRGLIINIDGTEKIKLDALGNKPFFLINQATSQDQFLQCCRAHHLEFKVFKQEGAPIVINGTKEDQEILIDHLRALYNYTIDSSMFPNAGFIAQKWVNEHRDELEIDEEDNGSQSNTNNHTGTANLSNPADGSVSKLIDGKQLVAEYGSLLEVYVDEFEDRVEIVCKNDMTGNPELDAVCKRNDVVGPNINFQYTSTVGTSFAIRYSDVLLRTVIEKDQLDDLAERVSSPCKGMIINIDDGEKIKLMVTEKIGGNSDDEMLVYFELTQEQFLKCCNANSLEFRIFKEDASEPIIIRGSAEDEELLITSIRAIYNVTVQEIFPNAKLKLQSLIERKEAKKAQVEKAKKETEDKIAQSFNNKKTTGIVLAVVGGFLFLISFFFMENLTTCLILLSVGIILVFVGLALYIYGNLRKNGATSAEAWDGITEAFKNIH